MTLSRDYIAAVAIQRIATAAMLKEFVHEDPLGASDRSDRFIAAHGAFPFLFHAAGQAHRVVAARRLLDIPS